MGEGGIIWGNNDNIGGTRFSILAFVKEPEGQGGLVGQLSRIWPRLWQYLHSILGKSINLWLESLQFLQNVFGSPLGG